MLTTASHWKPNAILKASILVHGIVGVGLITAPSLMLLWLGILVSNHTLLTIGGLLPRAKLLGPNITRLPLAAIQRHQIAITFDDGPDPIVTPQILAILECYQAKATFFCIGQQAQKHPELIQKIIRNGHQVENHSYRHRKNFAFLGPKRAFEEISQAQQALQTLTATTPRFFRPMAGIRNPLLDPVLHKLDMRLVSWSHRGFDTQIKKTDRVLRLLNKGLRAGSILLLHDGNTARTQEGIPVSVACLPEILQRIANAGLTTITLDEAFPRQTSSCRSVRLNQPCL